MGKLHQGAGHVCARQRQMITIVSHSSHNKGLEPLPENKREERPHTGSRGRINRFVITEYEEALVPKKEAPLPFLPAPPKKNPRKVGAKVSKTRSPTFSIH